MSGIVLSAQSEWQYSSVTNKCLLLPWSASISTPTVLRPVQLWHNFYSCGLGLTDLGWVRFVHQSVLCSQVCGVQQEEESSLSSLSLSLLHSQSVTTIFIIQPSIAPHQLPGQAWIMSTGKLVHHSFLSLLYISSFIEIFNCGVWEARKCWINSTQVRRLSCFSTFITVPYLCPRHYLSKTGLTTNNII